MSKRTEVQKRLHVLNEIQGILNAMKNLSLMETSKINHFLEPQKQIQKMMDTVLADFRNFFEDTFLEKTPPLTIIFGSERGFCGGFNEGLLHFVKSQSATDLGNLVVVGQKLATHLENHPQWIKTIPGVDTTEEIPKVLSLLLAYLNSMECFTWRLLSYQDLNKGPQLIAPFERKSPQEKNTNSFPPNLRIAPQNLYPPLMENALFHLLNRSLYLSFFLENKERLRHMEGALQTLDKEKNRLNIKKNLLRQEEITEELELILLNAEEMRKDLGF